MAIPTSEIRRRLFRLLKNSLILYFIFIFFNLLRPQFASLFYFEVGGFTITSELISNILFFIFIIYFGYFVLIDSKYFLDFISIKLERKERGKAKSISYDVTVIISLILASQLLTPFIASISDVGDAAAKVIDIVCLAIGFFIVYHLANEIYYLIKKHFEKLIEETSRQIKKGNTRKTSKQGESN
jgi:hypothetical protein